MLDEDAQGPQAQAEAEVANGDVNDLRTEKRDSCNVCGDCERFGAQVLAHGDAVTGFMCQHLRGRDPNGAACNFLAAFTFRIVESTPEGEDTVISRICVSAHGLFAPYRVILWAATENSSVPTRAHLCFEAGMADFKIVYQYIAELPSRCWSASLVALL